MLNMLRRLDKIRFRGHKRDDFLDLAESPNASDTECGDDVPLKMPRASPRDSEELRDPVSLPRRGLACPPRHSASDPHALGVVWGPPSSGGRAERGQRQVGLLPLYLPCPSRLLGFVPRSRIKQPVFYQGSVQQLDFLSFLTGFLGSW